MSDYKDVVIQADAKGRMNISVADNQGVGHGYRLAGSEYDGGAATVIAKVVLNKRDVAEIRSYLAIWDEIQAEEEGGKQ